MISVSMTIAFLIMQVPYGLLFGLTVGILGMVPYGAAVATVAVSILAAFISIWLGLRVLVVAVVIEQVVESAIAPKLVGGFIGLNPVWILVSLLIGTRLGGFLGLIVAVPVASAIKTLIIEPSLAPSEKAALVTGEPVSPPKEEKSV